MRIGIDVSPAGGLRTGSGYYTHELVRHLLDLDSPHEFVLFCRRKLAAANPLLEDRRNRVTHVVLDAARHPVYQQVILPVALQRYRVDVYHSPAFFLPLTWPGRKVVTIHDVNFLRFRKDWWQPGKRVRWLDLVAEAIPSAWAADRVITVSTSSKQDIIKLLRVPAEKINLTYQGSPAYLQTAPSGPDLERVRACYGVKPFFLYVGVLSSQKNLERLIEAFARLIQRTRLPLHLILVGREDGTGYQPRLDQLVQRHDLEERVIFTGYVDQQVLRALYHTAVALVAPYLGEGFGLPVIEAMTCGTPVITSAVSSLPEVAGNAALFVDPLDVETIVQAMQQVWEDVSLRDELRRRGYQQAARFTWPHSAARTMEVYETMYREARTREKEGSGV